MSRVSAASACHLPDSQSVITKGRNTAEGETRPISFTSSFITEEQPLPAQGPAMPAAHKAVRPPLPPVLP